MSPKADAKSAAAVEAQMMAMGIIKIYEWNGWKAGDRCGIKDVAGEFVIESFRLIDDVLSHVTVIGGPVSGQAQTKEFRSFPPDWLTTKILKRNVKKDSEDE